LGGTPYDDPGKKWTVAVIDDHCVGISCYTINKTTGHLKSAYVLPEYRGEGIYSELLTERINQINAIGISKIKCTATEMSKNILEKNGFVCIGNIGKYYKMEYNVK
jgi:N-acetylglutamate synthase-like GNAT family acetyltransferase